ncbi:hypothetical protein KP509_27G015500 [Ceratopteris richardii]|uniref:Uncharacterized protein n=1 Tax=Ceratopteris richardii TaxID=49495 RepID=A0A8T2RGP9_CERRI|nr:hypothetical protein KP509_27G015500 [Ceratopteris richardii]
MYGRKPQSSCMTGMNGEKRRHRCRQRKSKEN